MKEPTSIFVTILNLVWTLLVFPVHGFVLERTGCRSHISGAVVGATPTTNQAYRKAVHIDANPLTLESTSIGAKIKQGESVILLSGAISQQECAFLVESCAQANRQSNDIH
jgi:hypothetical protein